MDIVVCEIRLRHVCIKMYTFVMRVGFNGFFYWCEHETKNTMRRAISLQQLSCSFRYFSTYTPCFIKTTPYLIAHNFGKC